MYIMTYIYDLYIMYTLYTQTILIENKLYTSACTRNTHSSLAIMAYTY